MRSIENRRSIRKFKEDGITMELLEQVLFAGIKAPSSKNKQPWRFVVLGGKAKKEMLHSFEAGLVREQEGNAALLEKNRNALPDAWNTLNILKQAPIVILVLNAESGNPFVPISKEERVAEIANTQSIGAAIENMLLAAQELGLGSLWVCNTFFAYTELSQWIGSSVQLAAALALGYADEEPMPRPRKKLADVVTYRLEE
ncbi:MAG: nitroreductase family protein [Clostridium sp.]|nr:nitroreductase family protein [Clostridium sp.]MDU7339064.1 nitroreductase family protein [Clostridium sp.]